jgi:hypothetical protein
VAIRVLYTGESEFFPLISMLTKAPDIYLTAVTHLFNP